MSDRHRYTLQATHYAYLTTSTRDGFDSHECITFMCGIDTDAEAIVEFDRMVTGILEHAPRDVEHDITLVSNPDSRGSHGVAMNHVIVRGNGPSLASREKKP